MLCWSCNRVKGKRACPAHGGEPICSKCCGTKRRVEIRCPDDCPYLYGEHDTRWEPPSRKSEEALFIAQYAALSREKIPLLVFLHHLLLQARSRLASGLTDPEVAEVVSTLSRTFDTLTKGIVYEHKSESPRLQAVIGWVGKMLEKRGEIPEVPRASDAEVLEMLQSVSAAVETFRQASPTTRSYLDTAARVFRTGLERAPTLEVPGETGTRGLIVEP